MILTAADLNKAFDDCADKLLVPIGFKKSGVNYYKKTDDHFYGILKHTIRGGFMDYYLTYSHASAGAPFALLQKKPAVMLKDYPVSIAVTDLKIVYRNNDRLIDSPFYFYSLSRGFNIDERGEESAKATDRYYADFARRYNILLSDRHYLDKYIKDIFEIITDEGFRFFGECDLNLCYKSVLRPIEENKNSQYKDYYQGYLDSINAYYEASKLEKPIFPSFKKSTWFGKLFKVK